MNSRKSRQYRRVAQACENCRRKKVRCLGERPQCSNCTRLSQQCSYADGENFKEQASNDLNGHVADRLIQLEEKLDMILGRVEPQSINGPSPYPASAPGRRSSVLFPSPSTSNPSSLTTTLLPREVIEKAVDIFFQRVHRQPLWLWETRLFLTPECSEELLCAVLSLSLTYATAEFAGAGLRSPGYYSSTAHRLCMTRVTDGTGNVQTLQALCLLAFFNVIAGDLHKAGLNTVVAREFVQYSTLTAVCINLYYGTLYAYTVEVFPSAHRATGNGIAVFLNRVMGLLSAVIAVTADTATTTPLYVSAALFLILAIVSAALPFEPYGHNAS